MPVRRQSCHLTTQKRPRSPELLALGRIVTHYQTRLIRGDRGCTHVKDLYMRQWYAMWDQNACTKS